MVAVVGAGASTLRADGIAASVPRRVLIFHVQALVKTKPIWADGAVVVAGLVVGRVVVTVVKGKVVLLVWWS